MGVRCRIGALAQVEQEARGLRQPREESAGVRGVDIGNARCGVGEVGVARLLDVADDPEVVALDPGVAVQGNALRGGRSAEQALHLDVAHHRLGQAGRTSKHLHRPADEPAIDRPRGPPVAVGIRVGHVPQAQGVVAEMVVQLDQARVDRAAGGDARGGLEPRGDGCPGFGHCRDRAATDVHRAAIEHGPGVVDGHHAPEQDIRVDRRVRRDRGRTAGSRLADRALRPGLAGHRDGHQESPVRGQIQVRVCRSSGAGRATELLWRGVP